MAENGLPAVQRGTGFEWNKTKLRAAKLFADSMLSDEAIAAKVGCTRRQLSRWKLKPEFQARIELHIARLNRAIYARGIAQRCHRVRALNDRWERMNALIAARSDDPTMKRIAGGETGLLVRTEKIIGSGDNATLVEEFAVDTALLKELREHEKQAAQELGQWVDKLAPVSPDGQHEYAADFTPEEKQQLLGAILARFGVSRTGQAEPGQADGDGQALALPAPPV